MLYYIILFTICSHMSNFIFIYLIIGDDVYYILIVGVSGVKDKGKGVYEQ